MAGCKSGCSAVYRIGYVSAIVRTLRFSLALFVCGANLR